MLLSHDTIVEGLVQIRQVHQQGGRCRLKGDTVPPRCADTKRELYRLGMPQTLMNVRRIRPLHRHSDQPAEFDRDLRREYIALPHTAPGFPDKLRQFMFLAQNLFRRNRRLQSVQ